MQQLQSVFGLDVRSLGDDAAEITWNGGVAVAQTERPADLHGPHAGSGWTYVVVDDPDRHYARAVGAGAETLNEPYSTPDGLQRGYSARDREGNLWTFGIKQFGVRQ